MASNFYTFEITVDLRKADAWEVEWVHHSAQSLPGYAIKGGFLVFIYEDCSDFEGYGETPPITQEGYAESLDQILYNLMAKRALSLTYISHWNPGNDGGWREESTDLVGCAEQIPTLILQEVLAKRLEMSV